MHLARKLTKIVQRKRIANEGKYKESLQYEVLQTWGSTKKVFEKLKAFPSDFILRGHSWVPFSIGL